MYKIFHWKKNKKNKKNNNNNNIGPDALFF